MAGAIRGTGIEGGVGVSPESLVGQEMRTECGVSAVCAPPGSELSARDLAAILAIRLSHRGSESVGLFSGGEGSRIIGYQGVGSPKEVLTPRNLSGLEEGPYSVTQSRYSTSGNGNAPQPIGRDILIGNQCYVVYGENGNSEVLQLGHPSDTYEKVDNGIAPRLRLGASLEEAVIRSAEERPDGAFAFTSMTEKGILVGRDHFGRRPLFWGEIGRHGVIAVASETPALEAIGVNDPVSLPGGYMMKLVSGEEPAIRPFVEAPKDPKNCIFEAVYFSRANGRFENKWIYEIRKRSGEYLAKNDMDLEVDLAIAIPESARAALEGYAKASGIPTGEALIRSGDDRAFMQTDSEMRDLVASFKHDVIKSQVKGKKVVVIDDSIVRGNTLNKIIQTLRDAGAAEIHIRIASPPIMWPCRYGVDIPTREELVAFQYGGDVNAIKEHFSVESLRYLELGDLRKAIGGRVGRNACAACISGRYPVNDFSYINLFN